MDRLPQTGDQGRVGRRLVRTALVHYWLAKYRGGERLLELFSDLYPDADLFTLVHRQGEVGPQLERHTIHTSFIQRLPFGVSRYRVYLPLMPFAVESFDLDSYDLVISSESGPAKGVITRPETCHVCYCETPMRYLWTMYHSYRSELGFFGRPLWSIVSMPLRIWDRASADRVDFFIANSANVAKRIWKYYRRPAAVVHCPVDWDRFRIGPDDGYYLFVGELTEYKGIRTAVEAFRGTDRKLLVVGDGPLLSEMKSRATPNIEFIGWRMPDELVEYYAGCRGFVFPGEEDFGITPLEAMASGKPVIALGKGGALETVAAGKTGVFFQDEDPLLLRDALGKAESAEWDPVSIREHARGFGKDVIREELRSCLERFQEEHRERLRNVGVD